MKNIMEMIESAMAEASMETNKTIMEEISAEEELPMEVSFTKEAGVNKPDHVRINATPAGTFHALCELTMAWAGIHPEEMRESCIELLRVTCLRELREGSGKENEK